MSVKPIPDGFHTATPYLIVDDAARTLEFYKNAFGAIELFRMASPDGKVVHAEMTIGDSRIMLGEECPVMGSKSPKTLGGSSTGLMLYVENVDRQYQQAIAAGAKELRPPTNQFYGDRSGTVTDPSGHVWTVATHIEDVTEEECHRRYEEMMKSKGEAA